MKYIYYTILVFTNIVIEATMFIIVPLTISIRELPIINLWHAKEVYDIIKIKEFYNNSSYLIKRLIIYTDIFNNVNKISYIMVFLNMFITNENNFKTKYFYTKNKKYIFKIKILNCYIGWEAYKYLANGEIIYKIKL